MNPAEMNTVIAVVTHRPYRICEDELYLLLMAGSDGMPEAETTGYVRDDSGDNISDRNPWFCELTGLYWMWKNSDADNIGICHYRRYFARKKELSLRDRVRMLRGSCSPFEYVLRNEEASRLMERYPVVLPCPRRYHIESSYSHFAHSHGAYALDETRRIIIDRHPEYIEAYDTVMARTSGHRFNMFIMRKDLLDRYCSWLFDILFELEKSIATGKTGNVPDTRRLYGHVSERLLDVWLEKEGCGYCEIPYVFIGKEHLVRKAAAMIVRKIRAKS